MIFPQVFFHRIFPPCNRAVILCALRPRCRKEVSSVTAVYQLNTRSEDATTLVVRSSSCREVTPCSLVSHRTFRTGALRSLLRWDHLPTKYETPLPVIRVKDAQLNRVSEYRVSEYRMSEYRMSEYRMSEYRVSTRITPYIRPGNPVRRCTCDKVATNQHTGSRYLCLVLR